MNTKITIISPLFESSSGKVYLVEEMSQNNSKIKYFAFEFRKDYVENQYFLEGVNVIKNLKRPYLFRNYQKMYKSIPQELFLYEYTEVKFLDKLIIENLKQLKSFDNSEIQLYLKQLLEALYELHSNKMPGRLFSVQNILYTQPSRRIILMDFGFGSDVDQDRLDILAPPEYLESLIEKNENDQNFDLKFDSWLVGAFLYNFIKLKPINYIEIRQNKFERFQYNKKEQYLQHLKTMKFIPCQTNRYTENLWCFVQSLLTCDKDSRLSFYQIYQHQYIQNLQFADLNKYLSFYNSISTISDYFQVIKRTDQLQKPLEAQKTNIPYSYEQFQPSNQASQNQSELKEKPKPRIIMISPKKDDRRNKNFPDYYSVIMKQPYFVNNRFNSFWLQIQLDYLKCYILADTGEKIISLLSRYKYPLEQVLVYFVKKMHFYILRDTNNYLKSEYYGNKIDQDWKTFLDQYSNDLFLSGEITKYMEQLTKELINIFRQHCKNHLDEKSSLSGKIKKSLQDDQAQNCTMILNSQQFSERGYTEALEILLQFVNQLKVQDEKSEELLLFSKQIYICITITSLNKDNFQEIFKEILPEIQQIKPSDIMAFLGFVDQN